MLVLFDIDDTLLAHSQAEHLGCLEFFDRYGGMLPHPPSEFPQIWRDLAETHFAAYMRGEVAFLDQRRIRIRHLFPGLSDAECDARFEVYLAAYERHWRPFDDALDCVASLGGHTLGVISNGIGAQQRPKLESMGILDYFSVVTISGDVGWHKPDRRVFLHTCALAGFAPEETIYIGDRLEIDAIGATRAGLKGIWLRRDQPPADAADITTITTLNDLNRCLGS